jgi:hypothetical protein
MDMIKQANRLLSLRFAAGKLSRPYLTDYLIGMAQTRPPLKVTHIESYSLFEEYLI